MKKIACIILIIIMCMPFSACDNFKVPPSMEAENGTKLFNNSYLNGKGLLPRKLVLREDGSGYMEYKKVNATIEEVIPVIDIAMEKLNKDALGEGNYQAGFRVIYINPKNIKQVEKDVSVLIEFSDISHVKSDIEVSTLEDFLQNDGNLDLNNNFTDAHTKEKSSIAAIENKEGYYVAEFNNVTNQPVTLEDCRIAAYYTENNNDLVILENNTITITTGHFYVLYKKEHFPVWLIIVSGILLLGLIVATAIKFIGRNKNSNKIYV